MQYDYQRSMNGSIFWQSFFFIIMLGCLYTEWFDFDDPTHVADTESVTQNMAFSATLPLSGRFRMCPRIRQKGPIEFQSIEGQDIPEDQRVEVDLTNRRLTCKNKEQITALAPPYTWFTERIKCRDYKMR